MLRTILSENQYDPKLVTTANMNPSRRPCAPPSAWPIPINNALRTPSSNAVLMTLDMVVSDFRLQALGSRLSALVKLGAPGLQTSHFRLHTFPILRSYRVASSPATSAARTGSHSTSTCSCNA